MRHNYLVDSETQAGAIVRSPGFVFPAELEPHREWLLGEWGAKRPAGLYIWGPVGTGKTVAAYTLGDSFFTDRGLIQQFREALNPERFEKTHEGLLRSLDVRHPVIDDLGSGSGYTEWEMGILHEVIDRIYRCGRGVVVTSNRAPSGLSKLMGDRMTSRLIEMCRVVELKGEDRRMDAAAPSRWRSV